MLEALDNPGIDGVVLHKLDRLSRNVGDFALVDRMMALGKEFIVIEGRFDTSRPPGDWRRLCSSVSSKARCASAWWRCCASCHR